MSDAGFSAVFLGGRFVPPEEAWVRATDPGYLLGDGVFETLRAYDGVCFRTEEHLATLTRGAAVYGLVLPVTPPELAAVADEAAARAKSANAYVRITLTRGGGPEGTPDVLTVLSRPLVVPSDADYALGARATVVRGRRVPPACMDPSIKSTSYAPQVLARRESVARGFGEGEGIMLAIDGTIACGTMANLFLVQGDVLRTAPLTTGCRSGITRAAVLEVASTRFAVREEPIALADLDAADEAFFTSSRVECLPIASVDDRPIGAGRDASAWAASSGPRHPRTTALREALRACVRAESPSRSAARARVRP